MTLMWLCFELKKPNLNHIHKLIPNEVTSDMFNVSRRRLTVILACASGIFMAWLAKNYIRRILNRFTTLKTLKTEEIVIATSVKDCEVVAENLKRHCEVYRVLGFDCEWITEGGKRNSIALLQLASHNGYCALVRMNLIPSLPKELKELLADSSIYKVGVVPENDARLLLADYGIIVRGCLDLRHLDSKTAPGGLSRMAKEHLGIEMDKEWRITCSNWEAFQLTSRQVRYAADDALVAVKLFDTLIQPLLTHWWWSKQPKWHEIAKLCHRFIDVGYNTKTSRESAKSGNAFLKPTLEASKCSSRGISTRKKPLYDNCYLQAPDGELLSTIDRKKAYWYVDNNLGEMLCDNPITVRLNFEPAGRSVGEAGLYYVQAKANCCVVCGLEKSYLRKSIVPHEYRKYFPVVMKEHQSHDVLLLCLNCHQRSNKYDAMLRQQLALECNAPIGIREDRKVYYNRETSVVRSAGRALLSENINKIPEWRRKQLHKTVLQYFDAEGDECTNEMAIEASNLQTKVLNCSYKPHGETVVAYFSQPQHGGLVEFEKRWREHFLKTMSPKYLPALWSVSHNHHRLTERIAQNRILPEEIAVSGLREM